MMEETGRLMVGDLREDKRAHSVEQPCKVPYLPRYPQSFVLWRGVVNISTSTISD